jgi:hypothetical protein
MYTGVPRRAILPAMLGLLVRASRRGLLGSLMILTGALARPQAGARDHVRITSLSPPGPLIRGVPTTITLVAEVELESASAGIAQLGFNGEQPGVFRMAQSQSIQRGPHTVSFRLQIIPVDWGVTGAYAAIVNIGPRPSGPHWTPVASARLNIQVAR